MAPRQFNKTAVITLGGLVFIALLAFVWPNSMAPCERNSLGSPGQRPCAVHPLGTDAIGRDILSALIFSARASLSVGLLAALLSTLLGVCVGLISGYHRGIRDELLMRVADLFLLMPGLPLIIVLAAYWGPGAGGVILVIALTAWPSTARVVRSRTLQLRETHFVRGARALGAGPFYIMFRHILPNILEIVWAKGMLAAAAAMVTEAGISFLGLSDPGYTSWGTMIHDAFSGGALVNGYYWWYLPPICCISASVLVLTIAGRMTDDIRGPAGVGPETFSRPDSSSCPETALLSVENLTVDFMDRGGTVNRALDDVHLILKERDKTAVVGQTGSGKSVLLLALLRLLPENASISGTICYQGINLLNASEKELLNVRGRKLGYTPQGTGDAFNPLLTVGSQIAESARRRGRLGKRAAMEKAVSLLAKLGIENPEQRARDYPHRYSGGMLQRALLASVLALGSPVLLIDEPTKGLGEKNREETIQAILALQSRTTLLVTHDLEFAERCADRIVVMFSSKIVEIGDKKLFFQAPLHPYSKALLAAQPQHGMKALAPLSYKTGNGSAGESGCPFRPWCAEAFFKCVQTPPMMEAGEQLARCWRYGS